MKTYLVPLALIFLALIWFAAVPSLAQTNPEITGMMNSGFQQLQAGNLPQAQGIFEEVLRRDPGNSLALNNLAAILVKKGNYNQALRYLREALPRAKTYKVTFNRVCSLEGVCAVARLSDDTFGTQDLAALIEFNIRVVEGIASGQGGGKR